MARTTQEKRDKVVVAGTLALVVIAIAALLISFAVPEEQAPLAARDMKVNPPTEKARGVVSVWVKPGVDPKAVLVRYGVDRTTIHLISKDKAVGEIEPASVQGTVHRLQGDPRVRDAGFVTAAGGAGALTLPLLGLKRE